MASQRLPPGAEVVSQGATSDALFFLRSGAARAVRPVVDRVWWGLRSLLVLLCSFVGADSLACTCTSATSRCRHQHGSCLRP